MTTWVKLRNIRTGEIVLEHTRLCVSFWCHFRGLQFVRNLPEDQGLLFVTGAESRTNTSIHMFFMFISIAVIWMDKDGKVVDKKIAKPWRPAYAPSQPAQYYLEANTSVFDRVEIGDILKFDEEVNAPNRA